jgi:hypothetical protein
MAAERSVSEGKGGRDEGGNVRGKPLYGRKPRVSSSGDEGKGDKKGSSGLGGVDTMRLGDPMAVTIVRDQLNIYMQQNYGKYGEFINSITIMRAEAYSSRLMIWWKTTLI